MKTYDTKEEYTTKKMMQVNVRSLINKNDTDYTGNTNTTNTK